MTSEDWPITDAELHARLRLDHDGFRGMMQGFVAGFGAREFSDELLKRAHGYPWYRPAESFVAREGEIEPFDAALTEGRHALLAIGSNAAPKRLAQKLGHFEDPEDRMVAVECGELQDFDVGPVPTVTIYGSMPATLFPSPGTRCRLAVLWVTPNQLTQLTWTEVSYRFGRLDGVRFDGAVRTLYVYVSRLGTFAPDGEPLALAAIPAENRSAPAHTQEELLERAAEILGQPDGAALVRFAHEAPGKLFAQVSETLWPIGTPFEDDRWTPFT